ncbi:MAG TPA: CPBP family intramembrane metalloprotease [Bacteroidales bacterium]|nr:CPBP family intramembrane metalloprotease [Bacteroidales bacterium]HPS18464.1 CPBP family intramembrane metalloprotease [Bacteroidales bacterium]
MKKLIKYMISFIKDDFNIWSYGIAFIFLVAAIGYNYSVDFEHKVLDSYCKKPPLGMVFYFLFYAGIYYLMVLQKTFSENVQYIITKKKFWLKSFFFLLLLSTAVGFPIFDKWANSYNGFENYYLSKLAGNLRFVIVFIIPLIIIWKFFDKKTENLYGLTLKHFNAKPYFMILLLVLPLVIVASFQPDFIRMYPKFKPWFPQGDVFGLSRFQMSAIYEVTYASNFIMIEWFFRGALVIGMVAIMGRHAILPMAVTYCSLHFGKPMAECISSFFGGYFLGIIAMYTRSIFGGCIVHLGVALLMEAMAMIQYYFIMGK